MNKPKGYGFRPSEEELIGHLRDRTFLGRDFLVQDITDLGADICKWAPWDLPGCTTVISSDPEWYFIYPITYKHPKKKPKMIDMATHKRPDGKRMPINRVTNYGRWKESGKRLKVKASDSKKEIAEKTRLYFDPSRTKNENNKKSKAKDQNKSLWVLYQYELIDVAPHESKYFLGQLMRQSEPTNISNRKGETSQQLPSDYIENDHFPTPEVQLDFNREPLVRMEVSNEYYCIQNQSSEQHNEFVNSFPVVNNETYPEERSNQENFVNDGNEVISNLMPSNLQNYVADYAIPQNLQVDYTDISQMNLFDFDDLYGDGICLHELYGVSEAPDNNGDGVQNQSSINQQVADEFRNSNLIDNEIAYPDERSKSTAAEIDLPSLGMTESSNLMELISNPEVPNIGIGTQNQLYTNQQDHSFQSVLIDNDETYLEERSNQHNIVARKESFNLSCNFNNYPIADISQMNLFEFDDLYWHGICLHELCGVPQAPNNNGDGIQNHSSINQQVADEFRNSNLIDNEIVYPDERSKSTAAEIDLPSLGMTESSNLMELISNPEVPNIGFEAQNQLYTNQQDHSLQSVLIDNDETYLEERSNQHNIVARKEGFNLPCNFNNYPIADISQMNLFEFDDLYWHGICLHELCGVPQAPNNNGDGIQNQSSINQQVADEFRNSNLIDNEIVQPDERSKSAAAEIEGSDLPSLGMIESSYLMEAFRKRSSMEHEGSSIDIETEVAQSQAKKSRFK